MSITGKIGLAVALWGAMAVAAAQGAEAKQIKYVGQHPLPAELGGGFCYIEFPHVHVFTPAEPEILYRVHAGAYLFVGDPVAHGYDGPKHAYYGPHPIRVEAAVIDDDDRGDDDVYCYIEGPHYHEYAPPAEVKFTLRDGVYFYVGDYPEVFVREQPRYHRINVHYKPIKYQRPVVIVTPPPEWHPPVYEAEVDVVPAHADVIVPGAVVVPAHTGHPHGGVGVGIGVSIDIPVPTVEVHVPSVEVHGGAGVIVGPGPVHHDRDHRGKKKGHH
jgi:hypothetical protein